MLAYTFDAGPNAVLFIHQDIFQDLCNFIKRYWKLDASM